MSGRPSRIDSFGFAPGRRIGGKYVIEEPLGGGWEGEVYRVVEAATRITRAIKLFFPHRNPGDRAVRTYARKLERLRHCPAIVQYHHTEEIRVRGHRVTALVSEFVEGEKLDQLVRRQPGGRMHPYEAACLLHALAVAIEQIHEAGEYHGDLHEGNVLVMRRGIAFELHIVDFFRRDHGLREARRDDITDSVRLFYEALGGRRRYAAQPDWVKDICKGLRRDLILGRFPTATRLRRHLESFEWT